MVVAGRTTSSNDRRGSTASTSSRPGTTPPKRRSRIASAIALELVVVSNNKLLPSLRFPGRSIGMLGADHPVPGVTNRRLDLLPGRCSLAAVLVRVPPLAEVRLGFVPLPSHMMLGGFKSIAIRGPELIVVIRAQCVRATAEVLEPIVVFGVPGRLPLAWIDLRHAIE